MLVKSRRRLPQINELVVGTISRIEKHGAYVILDEYENQEGMVQISEVAPTHAVQKGQEIVTKVLRINERKGYIDLTIGQVTPQMRMDKLNKWKRKKIAVRLQKLAMGQIEPTPKICDTKQRKTSPVVLTPRFGSALQLPARVQRKATHIAWRARKRGLLGKKKPASVAGAALYIACLLEGTPCTQLQIARVAGITQHKLRIRYKDIVKKLKIPIQIRLKSDQEHQFHKGN